MTQDLRTPSYDVSAKLRPGRRRPAGTGIFGLPFTREQSRIVIVPVPFDATASYGTGAALAPAAVLHASRQVDLFDMQFGNVHEQGIVMLEADAEIAGMSAKARHLAEPLIAKGGAHPEDHVIVEGINAAGQAVNVHTHQQASQILSEGKVPALLGGDHSTPFGAILACAEFVEKDTSGREGLGILHLDAHMDLRQAFEGFQWSHASIMFNVLERIPQISRLVQCGIRDYGKGEMVYAQSLGGNAGPRVVTHFDLDWARRADAGERFAELARQAVEELPRCVYVSFDIDVLNPALCPHTGTPVPGGLSFNRACVLLETLARSGRTIIGFDLVEVAPRPQSEGAGVGRQRGGADPVQDVRDGGCVALRGSLHHGNPGKHFISPTDARTQPRPSGRGPRRRKTPSRDRGGTSGVPRPSAGSFAKQSSPPATP